MERLKRLFENHGISTKIVNSRLFVLYEWNQNGVNYSKWLDASEFTREQTLNFLGYELAE